MISWFGAIPKEKSRKMHRHHKINKTDRMGPNPLRKMKRNPKDPKKKLHRKKVKIATNKSKGLTKNKTTLNKNQYNTHS